MNKDCKKGRHRVESETFSHTMYMNYNGNKYRYEFKKITAQRCIHCKGFYTTNDLQRSMNLEFENYIKEANAKVSYIWEVFDEFIPESVKMELKKDCVYCEGEGFLYCSSKFFPDGMRKVPCSVCLGELSEDDRVVEKNQGIDRYELLSLIYDLWGGFDGELGEKRTNFVRKCVNEYIEVREFYEKHPHSLERTSNV